jgi:hypothetical protein
MLASDEHYGSRLNVTFSRDPEGRVKQEVPSNVIRPGNKNVTVPTTLSHFMRVRNCMSFGKQHRQPKGASRNMPLYQRHSVGSAGRIIPEMKQGPSVRNKM